MQLISFSFFMKFKGILKAALSILFSINNTPNIKQVADYGGCETYLRLSQWRQMQ